MTPQQHTRMPVDGSARRVAFVLFALFFVAAGACAATVVPPERPFPPPLESYGDAHLASVWEVLRNRVRLQPFNLWATVLFLGAVIHTFLTRRFLDWAHVVEERHRARLPRGASAASGQTDGTLAASTCMPAKVLHFLGEVEAIFGIWVLPLFALMILNLGWGRMLYYVDHRVSFVEPVFVVIIMAIASTDPVIRLAESCLRFFARMGGGGPGAWWFAILTVGPVLGSLITEPAAMTISALLLSRQFYELKPELRLAYATLGLLFVNISVGGVLTHFAAPPVLMVAAPWHWDTPFMFRHFGWVAVVGIGVANVGYYLVFRRAISRLGVAQGLDGERRTERDPIASTPQTTGSSPGAPLPNAGPGHAGRAAPSSNAPIPVWVTIGHLLFMAWTVFVAHYPVLLVAGFLFFIAFLEVTSDYQSRLQMRSPILVGCFLAGLVVHGGLQQWWIAPVLGRLHELPLMLGSIGLTAFNDNAAVTYLSTLVPGMTDGMKYAVVAGAVTGGGLTVIANAPNPAGQSILGRHFPGGISPLGLLLGALPATVILALGFLLLHG